ncbi:MAG: ABC transporter substrate binding protein [Nitrospirota bacterium]
MKHLFIIFFIFVLLIPKVQAQDRNSVTLGMLFDGESSRSQEFINELRNELAMLLGSKYDIQVPTEKILRAGWSADTANANYDRLVKDRQVDIIVSIGVLMGSVIASKDRYPKPVIVMGIIDPMLQGLTPADQKSSGVHNLTYILMNQSIERDLDVFYRVYPYKKVGMVASGELLKLLLRAEKPFQKIMEKNNTEFKPVPVIDIIDEALDSLDVVDAVYLGFLGKFEQTDEKTRLIRELNARNIPTFGFSIRDVELGVLAAVAPEENFQKIRRRIALNIEAILDGEDPANLPVHISFEENLTINMQTAREIGFSPKFEVLSEAKLVNEFIAESKRVLTLIDVMHEAINANLDLKIEEDSVKSAEKDVSLARSNFFPSLTLGAAGTQIVEEQAENSRGQQAERTTSGNIKVNQLIFSEEQMGNVDIQEYLLKASEYGYDQKKLDIMLDAASAYFNVLKAKTAVNIQQENINLTKKNLEISKQREVIGYSGRSDVYRWESLLATATTDLLEAKNNYTLAKIQLNRLMNRPLGEDFSAQESSLSDNVFGSYLSRARRYVDNPVSLDRYTGFLIKEAALNSPEIRQLDANIDAQERRLSSFKLKRFVPKVSLSSEAQRVFSRDGAGSDVAGVDPDNESWSVGLNLSVPLFEGGATSINIQQTRIEIRKLRDQRTQVLQSRELNVRAAVLELVSRRVNLISSQRSAEFSGKSLELVRDLYARGKVSIVDLLDSQNTSLSADLTALNSVYDFMISVLETERAVGRFTLLTTPEEQEDYFRRLHEYFAKPLS